MKIVLGNFTFSLSLFLTSLFPCQQTPPSESLKRNRGMLVYGYSKNGFNKLYYPVPSLTSATFLTY